MTTPVNKPAIPALGGRVDTDVRRAIDAIRDYLLHTYMATAGYSAATSSGAGSGETIITNVTNPTVGWEDPGTTIPTPEGILVTGLFNKIMIEWDTPGFNYGWIAYTQVYWNTEDVLGTASLLTNIPYPQTIAIHSPADTTSTVPYYYWLRFVTITDRIGGWNATAGTPGHTAADPTYLLEELAGKLGYGQFDVANGVFPVRLVSALPTLPNAAWPAGSTAYFSGKLYRTDGTTWTAAVPTVDLTGQITTTQITDDAITTAKIAALAITAAEIATNAITSDKILANAITAGKIAAAAIIAEHIGTNEIIALSANIKDGVIVNAKIGTAAIDEAKIANLAVSEAKIAAGAVTNLKIGNLIQSADGVTWSINKLGGIDARSITIRNAAGTVLLASGGTGTVFSNIATAQATADAAADDATVAMQGATDALSGLADIASDGKFTPIEKHAARQDWNAIYGEKADTLAKATSYGVSTTAYTTAYTNLANYLNNGTTWTEGATPPLWLTDAQLSVVTDIVGNTFRLKWETYYVERQKLLNAAADMARLQAGQKGTNLVPPHYATFNANKPPVVSGGFTTISMQAGGQFGYALRNMAGNTDSYVYLGATNIDFNIPITPGKKWRVSWFEKDSTYADFSKEVFLRLNDASLTHLGVSYVASSTSWTRRWADFDLSGSPYNTATKALLRFDVNYNGVYAEYDGIMVEEILSTTLALPSPFSIPGFFMGMEPINANTISTYIKAAAIGTAYIVDAAITTAKILDANITTLKIGTDQVTVPESSYTDGVSSTGSGDWVVIQSVTIDSGGFPLFFMGSFVPILPWDAETGYLSAFMRLRKGSSTVIYEAAILGGKWTGYHTQTLLFEHTPAAGSNTYYLEIGGIAGGGTLTAYKRALSAIGCKR